MLTGLPPRVHGVRRNGNKLAAEIPTLARLLTERGFACGAFLGAQFLGGIAQDFEHVSKRATASSALVDDALAWIEARGAQPTFTWLHLYDPHRWKLPKVPAWTREALAEPARSEADLFAELAARHGLLPADESGAIPWQGGDGKGGKHLARTRQEALQAIEDYDALIRLADSEAQRLYDTLARVRPGRRTLWILTSDHGEGLGSHGYEGHGGRIYNEQLRVALLFHASDRSLTARRESASVGHIDLLPTLAELFDLPWRVPHAEFYGRSLAPLLAGPSQFPARLFFGEQRRAEDAEAGDAGEMVALQDARHKLIRYPDGREEFFALDEDPLELRPLPEDHARRAELRAALEARREHFATQAAGDLAEPAPEFLDELQALGYAR
jgi:arylsulfatase A-like enzyme